MSGVDEDGVVGPTLEVAAILAERKARAVADQLVGRVRHRPGVRHGPRRRRRDAGKPPSLEVARAWWGSVSGRSATLHSGLCVIDLRAGRSATGVASTVVHYGCPTEREMDAYLATGEPLAVAGGFTIDGYAAPFVDGIDGDHAAVLGLSLPLLRRLLGEIDIEITDLWVRP